ncbi:MAG: hypothetical protein ABJB34_01455 [Acidobacteriota bacterium]
MVKEALCSYFKMCPDRSALAIEKRSFVGLGSPGVHYYRFIIADEKVKHSAFGKTTHKNEAEYQALQYITKTIPEEQRNTTRPIALLKNGAHSLLLLEDLNRYSSPLSVTNSLWLFPNRSRSIIEIGKNLVDSIYGLQRHCEVAYSLLSFEDIDDVPGQPLPTSIFKQLESIRSIESSTKAALRRSIDAIISNGTAVRRGLVHGQLGLRNIMTRQSKIVFIDWEYMRAAGLCIFDPCYMAVMILMRSVQLFLRRPDLEKISESLFAHIEFCEERLAPPDKKRCVQDAVWFAKCIAMIDTLWQYERSHRKLLSGLLAQVDRKSRYLVYEIETIAKRRKG